MQGIYVNGSRPASKKAIKAALQTDPDNVMIEATSIFGNEYSGSVVNMPIGTITFVGPDPHTNRKFYGNIIKDSGGNVRLT